MCIVEFSVLIGIYVGIFLDHCYTTLQKLNVTNLNYHRQVLIIRKAVLFLQCFLRFFCCRAGKVLLNPRFNRARKMHIAHLILWKVKLLLKFFHSRVVGLVLSSTLPQWLFSVWSSINIVLATTFAFSCVFSVINWPLGIFVAFRMSLIRLQNSFQELSFSSFFLVGLRILFNFSVYQKTLQFLVIVLVGSMNTCRQYEYFSEDFCVQFLGFQLI